MKALIILSISLVLLSPLTCGQIIADHTHTDIDEINEVHVSTACNVFRVYYGHTSHGSQIVTGMEVMESRFGDPWQFSSSGSGGELSLVEQYGDLGHNGDLAWEQTTRAQLNSPDNDRNVIIWSWCGGCSDNSAAGIDTYLNAMNQLEIDFPQVSFIYMTGHLDGSGSDGNLNQRNEQIRNFCRANNKLLFDFADIESFDPDGNEFMSRFADDECNYTGGNWADEWCRDHPVSDMCLDCDCSHSKPLNCNLKARAFWWLLAEMAENHDPGLPTPTPVPPDLGVAIDMPGHLFRSGDVCYCNVTVTNVGTTSLVDHPLFVILVVYDLLFWAPAFNDYDDYLDMYPEFHAGDTVVEVLPSFTWPPVGTAIETGCYFIAALTDPNVTTLIGNADIWEFGWLDY